MIPNRLFIALSVSFVLASCTIEEQYNDVNLISFGVEYADLSVSDAPVSEFPMVDQLGTTQLDVAYSVEDMPLPYDLWNDETKATLVTEADGMTDGFGARVYDGSQYVIDGELVTKNDKGKWTTAKAHPYDKDKSYTTLAYYPSTLAVTPGTGVFNYNVSSVSSSDVKDVMLAYANGKMNEGKVSLTFSHCLTAVRFIWGDVEKAVKIKSISLSGVYSSGKCTPNFSASPATYTWSNYGTEKITVTGEKSLDVPAKETEITDGAYTFLLIPQDLASNNTTITIVLNDGSKDFSVSKKLTSGKWEAGKINKYKLDYKNEFEYTIEDIPNVITTYAGGIDNLTVKSYKTNISTGTKSALAWKFQYQNSSSAWVDGIPSGGLINSFSKLSGNGGTSGENVTVSTNAQSLTRTTKEYDYHKEILQNSPELTDFDLSYFDPTTNSVTTVQNTANCYMVHAPGTYKFPVVYGNAIKNSATNTTAYIPGVAAAEHVLAHFVDHNDNPINAPYIVDQLGSGNYSAVLAWEDVDYLVRQKTISLSSDKRYISFAISASDIAAGNAVIALVKDGVIVWSWHIWVTDVHVNNTQAMSYAGHTYYIMPTNLGWFYSGRAEIELYETRKVKMRAVSTSGNAVKYFEVDQAPYILSVKNSGGAGTFYQWGRKDPLPPGNGLINGDSKRESTVEGSYHSDLSSQRTFTGTRSIGYSIQHPNQMLAGRNDWVWENLTNQGDWCTNIYLNRWNGTETVADPGNEGVAGSLVTKTIYDPSPVGFKVPNMGAMKGMFEYDPGSIKWNSKYKAAYATIQGVDYWLPCTGFRAVYEYDSMHWFGKICGYGTTYYDNLYDVYYNTATSRGLHGCAYFNIGINKGGSIVSTDVTRFWKSIAGPIRPIREAE